MWIVKNPLRATLSLRGLGVSIAPGDEFDLDALGRDAAEHSPQVAVAFEEGYLKNVFKAPREGTAGVGSQPTLGADQLKGLVTSADFEKFKSQFLDELKKQLPALQKLEQLDALKKLDGLNNQPTGAMPNLKEELEGFRKAIAGDVRQVLNDVQIAKEKIEAEKRKILSDASLSEAEIRARLSFLDDKERELTQNFETVGRRVEANDGDVQDKADLLSEL